MKTIVVNRFYAALAYILMMMGIIHGLMVLVSYDEISVTAIFSLGTGLAVIFLGMLNLAAVKTHAPLLFALAVIANVFQSVYSGLSLMVLKNDPQAHIGFGIFLILLLISLIAKKKAGQIENA